MPPAGMSATRGQRIDRQHRCRLLPVLLSLLIAAPAGAAVFGSITVAGNDHTGTDVILRELGFATGDSFDTRALDAAWERLEDLGYFAFVDIDYDDEDPAAPIPVTITVEEDRTLRGYPVIDYDRRFDIRLGVRLYDINFRGRGETLSVNGVWYRPTEYGLTWRHPWLAGVRGLTLQLDGWWRSADFEYRDIDFREWWAGGRLTWQFHGPLYVGAGLRHGSFEQKGPITGLPLAWPAGSRDRTTWSGELGLDSREPRWYPTRGAWHRILVERTGGGAFRSFTSWTGDLRQYLHLPWDHVLALHAWGRRVDGHLPPEDLLWWGGPETLRGADYASLVGEEGYMLSAEYRWPLFLMPITADGRVIGIGLHAFADLGNDWFDGSGRPPLYSYGAGFHIGISDHQFRFEIAVPEHGETTFEFMDAFNF